MTTQSTESDRTRDPLPARDRPDDDTVSTSSRATRVLGALILVGLVVLGWVGLVASAADRELGDTVRLLYVHVPAAITAYLACFVTTAASAVWLWKRTQWWDLVASSAAEIATVLTAITLVTGMLWGRPTWGAYWVWDARLTTTALLFLLLLGYQALRSLPADRGVRNRRSAVIGLLLVPNVVVVNRSVEWWRSLHQDPTLFRPDPQLDGLMLFAWFVGWLTMTLVFVWLLFHRFRVGYLRDRVDDLGLEVALAERRAEGAADAADAGLPPAAGAPALAPVFAATQPANAWTFVTLGWLVTWASIGAYALWLVRTGRRLAAQLPAEERRWM
ncbi:MAG: cytochrome c biogenesis protein CcsA [Acidimicrobiales bacterium]|nr:cytochrome c biogenesis protein CcsA [Acidimicrobiales bacterium]